ncbi:hypothetical protein GYMLUDRAFT_244008 [Collybiopsis luxurians FD-317 M1]|uniref:Uncharacterized protein n=1 Tax=Collybiopsis luxurians FD-317 M1 TaxID=944289 RepID=A0A0D0BAU9_9AGAR|nr:hypothetical protein GYMLUDRAFT_244008 [Collybiopsis luxurians FD-317 M1]
MSNDEASSIESILSHFNFGLAETGPSTLLSCLELYCFHSHTAHIHAARLTAQVFAQLASPSPTHFTSPFIAQCLYLFFTVLASDRLGLSPPYLGYYLL